MIISFLLLVQYGCSSAMYHQQVTSVCDMTSVVRGFDWVLCRQFVYKSEEKSFFLLSGSYWAHQSLYQEQQIINLEETDIKLGSNGKIW